MEHNRAQLFEQWHDVRDVIRAMEKFLIPVWSNEKAIREQIAETHAGPFKPSNRRRDLFRQLELIQFACEFCGQEQSSKCSMLRELECQGNGQRKMRLREMRSIADRISKEIERIDKRRKANA